MWKEELYPVGVGAFPFMEALGLRIEAIGSDWVTVFLESVQWCLCLPWIRECVS